MRLRSALLLLGVLTPALAGCSGTRDGATSPSTGVSPPSSGSVSPAASDAPGSAASVSSASAASEATTQGPDPKNPSPLPALTPAGSRVRLGQPVVVKIPVTRTNEQGWAYVRVVASSAKPAGAAAQKSMEKDLPQMTGRRLYAVHASFTVLALSGPARYGTVSPELGGVDEKGNAASNVVGGEADGCDAGALIDSSANLGDEYSGCFHAVAQDGTRVVGAYVTNSDSNPNDPYTLKPIVWMP